MQNSNETITTYICYETTNTVTGQTYSGVFSFKDTKRGIRKYETYIGQGLTYDGQAKIQKQTEFTKNVTDYGYDNFRRNDLLYTFNPMSAFKKEAEVVNEDYVNYTNTLNNQTGGKKGLRGKASRMRLSQARKGGLNHTAKKVKHLITGKVYDCIKDAATHLEMNYSTLKRQLQENRNPILKVI
jgi:hypothetical protein